MKTLDCALIGLLAGMAPLAEAMEGSSGSGIPQAEPVASSPQCTVQGCTGKEGLLFQVRTRSYDVPVTQGTDARSSSEALQPDRRVTVAMEQPGRAVVTGRFSITLACGAAIWATEDPVLGQPELSVSAPTVAAFEGGRITKPVDFYVRGNYPAFVERYEISLYHATDSDLIEPLAEFPVAVTGVSRAQWDGVMAGSPLRAGDELVYVLRAYDKEGRYDETKAQTLQLVTPQEAERTGRLLREKAQDGTDLSIDEALQRSLVDNAFAGNGLRLQNIPIYGSRIRIQGRDVPQGMSLTINGDDYPVDMERKFAAEYLVPVGRHPFEIVAKGGGTDGKEEERHLEEIDVTGRYFFAVGLADVTLSKNHVSGSDAAFANDSRYQDDLISDGRLAFYGKAKLGGKYLVTAQADTTERDLERLFDGFTRADPQDVFRRLDPDLYYPVYGDDSSVWRDVDTMGRFYLRVDWDKNQALWGNYATGLTGNEYAQYVRSLYGAALSWRSPETNPWGAPKQELRLFGSEAQTAPGHVEFLGTGGSLYYLRHTDLLPGSDTVVLEVRDLTTGRVERRIPLQRGADYEIDELQGRLLLTRPLAQITRENSPTLTRDTPLNGFEQRLVVDYEWVPSDFDNDQITAGGRARQWFGDHVGVGLTYVDEKRAGEDYTIMGGDLTLQAGKGTYVKAEYVQTESSTSPVFFSDNGGFSFTRLDAQGPREGEAKLVEARANFKELGWTDMDWAAGAWWREVGEGYSQSRYASGRATTEYGAEVLGHFTPQLGVYARYSKAESGSDALTQVQGTLEWRIDDARTFSAEIRRVQDSSVADAAGLLGALKYAQRVGTSLDLYGLAQFTLDDDHGRYDDNDALTLGGKYLFGSQSTVGAEVTTGDRGDAAQVNAEYRLSPDYTLYGAYTYSTDSTHRSLFDPDPRGGWTLGQRWRLSNQATMYSESQFLKEPAQSGLVHTYGMDFYPGQGWNLGFTLNSGELESSTGVVDRRAVSVSGGHTSSDTEWRSQLEWRRDTGAEQREQWVSTNRLTHKINESWRIAARLNYSDTDDRLDPQAGAKFIEGNFGFAYRPWDSTRWGLFGRYTYLYDLATLGQDGGAQVDQRSHVLSFEGVFKPGQHWEYAAKLARREGEVRMGRGEGEWFDSATTFAALQARYELRTQWHALAEYRWLAVDDGGTRRGFLVGLDRDIGRNFRIGVGYNFTDFSDDLTDFDYRQRGWFLNLTGRY
ncbi:hypothetical protein CSC74_03035 [Pseudoxanthomonas yeongjuensis]|uniref:TonB-dependent receptor n=1 Tax=Pseudoxanthomonas yeongjuensis TaxID=377616 RepID=UPI0013919DF6|nr:TonB-dependent receptor [Pseudoxanthomonas yeongjuensis]KAF1717896.1 hypothetical protein CSC74_03035 [Pseudoxanthomonas yeongjuensis]